MSFINIPNTKNIVSFCETSLNPAAMDSIIKGNRGVGLSDPALEGNLKAGNYQAVLVSVWSERDRTRRLEWLESKSTEAHPVLMFELSVAKFVATPTIETINLVSFPLMKAAAFRVNQDAQCAKDSSVKHGDAATRMTMTYQQRLNGRVQALLKSTLEKVVTENQDARIAAIKAKTLETAQLRDLPSPDWIGWHGLSVFSKGSPDMHPVSEYKQIRDAYADKAIDTLKK